ncbi:MAG: MotA/TolQ/ExbB proton channel family protein [Gammaproteobacteria bacterium]|nr:MotA/TolQ/ExbB proton channel family protein [Gammaproteobacteria bacterium]
MNMNKNVQKILALVIFFILVQAMYSLWILPNVRELEAIALSTGTMLPRNIFVIVKDFEQQVCFILFLWGVYLCVGKLMQLSSQAYLFDVDFLSDIEDSSSDIVSTLDVIDKLPEEIKETPLVQITSSALRRYAITGSIQNASEAITPALESMAVKNEAELSVIKYITWAVPSIGFLGTVRGIGQAMSQADSAVAGNIGPMTSSLGVAFNSTFVALMISLALMMLVSYLQRTNDDQLVKVQEYCEKYLIRRISIFRH